MKKIILFLSLILSFSCKYNEVPKPEKLLSKEEMEDIMHDLAILNAVKSNSNKVLEDNHIVPTKFLYKKHGIDSTQFAQNSIYYASQPNLYEEIIESVNIRLKREKDSLRGKTDSLEIDKKIEIEELKEIDIHQ